MLGSGLATLLGRPSAALLARAATVAALAGDGRGAGRASTATALRAAAPKAVRLSCCQRAAGVAARPSPAFPACTPSRRLPDGGLGGGGRALGVRACNLRSTQPAATPPVPVRCVRPPTWRARRSARTMTCWPSRPPAAQDARQQRSAGPRRIFPCVRVCAPTGVRAAGAVPTWQQCAAHSRPSSPRCAAAGAGRPGAFRSPPRLPVARPSGRVVLNVVL